MWRYCILSAQTIAGRQMLNSIVIVRIFCLAPGTQLNASITSGPVDLRPSCTSIAANNFINI